MDDTDSTQQEFDEIMGSSICIRLMKSSQGAANNPAAPNIMVSTVQAELQAFCKGIKQDAGLYPVMTHDTQLDMWNRFVVSIARNQAIEQVLDSPYQAVLPDKVVLFAEKQKHRYAVFERTLQTDKKGHCTCTQSHINVQLVYKEMYEYCYWSTRAMLKSSTLLSYITSACLRDGSYKSGTHKFILHWVEQIHQYEKLVEKTDHFSEAIKLHMLQKAIHPIPELR
jgi:hypothetical protein